MCETQNPQRKRSRNLTSRNTVWSSWFPLVSGWWNRKRRRRKRRLSQQGVLRAALLQWQQGRSDGSIQAPSSPSPLLKLVPPWLFPIRGRSFMCVSLKLGSQCWFYWRRGWAAAASSHCSRLQTGLRVNSLQMWTLLSRWVRMSLIGHDFSFCVGILVRACN